MGSNPMQGRFKALEKGEGKEIFNMPTIDMVKTGQNIATFRKQSGLSVKNLQDVFGFTTSQAIYKWQHGAALPTIDNLVVLAVLFGVKVDDILVVDYNVQTVFMGVSA